MTNENKNLKLRILATATLIVGIAAGFKLIHTSKQADAATKGMEVPKHRAEDTTIEYNEEKNTLVANDKEYNVKDVEEIAGKTVYFVSDSTPTPTPTPSATPTPEVRRYINTESAEYIAAEDGVYHEIEPKLNLTFHTVNEMIAFYSKVFQLNDEMVGNKIYEYINENPTAWDNDNILNGEEYDTKEEAIAKTIADISNFPEDYGFDEYEIATEEYELGHFKPEELIKKFCRDVLKTNEEVALSIAYAESGTKLDSYNFETRHNVGGMRRRTGDPHPTTSWGLVIYKNEAEGLYRFVETLHNNFFVDSDSGADRITSMSYTYCEDPAYWRNLVFGIYYNVVDNYSYYYDAYNYDRDLIYPEEVDNAKIK